MFCCVFYISTVKSLGILTGAQLFSLNKEELRAVLPEEGARVYSQIMVQKSLLEVHHTFTEEFSLRILLIPHSFSHRSINKTCQLQFALDNNL